MTVRVMLPHAVFILIIFVVEDVVRMAWAGAIRPNGMALTWCWALFVFSLVALRVLYLLETNRDKNKPLDTSEQQETGR